MKKPSFSKLGTEKSVVVVDGSAKEERPADFRELKECIEERDVDKLYVGYFRVKYITHRHLEC